MAVMKDQFYLAGAPARPDVSQETHLSRGDSLTEILREVILPYSSAIHVLEIGVGNDVPPFICPYEPYFIINLLQKISPDFRLTIVELDPIIIDDLKKREHIYTQLSDLEQSPKGYKAWQGYLAATRQEAREVSYQKFAKGRESDLILQRIHLMKNVSDLFTGKNRILAAKVPAVMQEKLEADKIRLVSSGVEKLQLIDTSVDVAVCMNVIYQLNQLQQREALQRIKNSVHVGGCVLLNDHKTLGTTLFSTENRARGWLSESQLLEMGFKIRSIPRENGMATTFLLQRVA